MLESNVHPEFLAQLKQLLPEAEIASFLETCHKPLKKSISIDPLRRTPELHELVTSRGWTLKQTPFTTNADTYWIDREDTSIALGNTALHQFGFFYMQEVAASVPAQIIPVEPNSLVLDMCAAP
jgi:16S rRNA (cytosine1407-C5)-methyltransferase